MFAASALTALLFAAPAPCQAHRYTGGVPLVVGDSVTLAAATSLGRRGFGVNARGCRQISEGLRVLRRLRPRRAVLALGANGRVTTRQLRAAANLTRDLVLVTPGGRDDGDRGRIVRFALGRLDVHLVDWARLAASHRGWLAADGLHLTNAGARAFAREIAKAV